MRRVGVAMVAIVLASAAAASGTVTTPHCRFNQLKIRLALASPGLGHHGELIRFTDQGGACTLSGYPGVDALSASRHRVLSARRTRSGYLGGLRAGESIPLVHLVHGTTASALLEWDVALASCRRGHYLLVTPPGAVRSVRFAPAQLTGEPLCRLQIHPVVTGRTGDG